jgi:hypothetical protein
MFERDGDPKLTRINTTMADSKVGRTRRVRAASTTSTTREMDDSIRRSCRGFPARTRNAASRQPRSGVSPALRLAHADSDDTNAADPAGKLVDWRHRHCPQGTRPPNIHDKIRHQCEAFLRDFNGCLELAAATAECVEEAGALLVEHVGGLDGGTDSRACERGTDASQPSPVTDGTMIAGEQNGARMRAILRRLVIATGGRAESASAQLQAFCRFLQSLIEARAGAHPSLVRAFCQSQSTDTASATEFARNHFDRLQNMPELTLYVGGDVVFLLLGCLAGKGINEIWSREAMQALPIAHLAYLNALASAAAKRPEAVKRVA